LFKQLQDLLKQQEVMVVLCFVQKSTLLLLLLHA